jgi:ComF family protein
MPVRDALLDALALLLPVECSGCGSADRSLCSECRAALVPDPTPRLTAGGVPVVTALRYEGPVRRVILALKEQGRTDAATALSVPLADAIGRATSDRAVELTPVPTSRAAYRRRGYDPVLLLMRRAGLRPARVLEPARRTSRQKLLSAAERSENLAGAFRARRPLAGRRFLVIDDILTTGATIDEAARAITAAGGEVLGGATVAFTPRLLPFRDIGGDEDYRGAQGAR